MAGGCGCGASQCGCGMQQGELYWCETCRMMFDSKRCPQCGLKLKKVRESEK